VSNLHEIPWAKAGREAESREEVDDGPLCGKWNKEADQAANAVYYLKQTRAAEVPLAAANIHPDDLFEKKVRALFEEACELLLSKHRAYGPKNIADAPGGALNGIRVRLHDKTSRINNLIDNNPVNAHESLRDSFLDAANYNLIACLVMAGDWPGAK
jgi:hypothetical protein